MSQGEQSWIRYGIDAPSQGVEIVLTLRPIPSLEQHLSKSIPDLQHLFFGRLQVCTAYVCVNARIGKTSFCVHLLLFEKG